jgi:uncharacterized repeat protein (TIGR01451 family)
VPEGTVLTTTARIEMFEGIDPTMDDHGPVTASITIHRVAELAIRQTPSTGSPVPGGQLTYALRLPNTGPSDASGVIVTDTLPDGLTFVPIDSSAGCTANGQVVTCNVGVVPPGETVVLQIATVLSPNITPGTVITNTASFVLNEADPTSHDQTTSVSLTVVGSVDLNVTQTASVNPVIAGGSFQYAVQVKNEGQVDATDVVLTDVLPAELTFDPANSSSNCSAVGQTVTCNIGNLAAGGITTRTIGVLVDSSTARGTVISNTVTVAGNETDEEPGNQSSTVTVTSNVDPDPFPWQNVKNELDVNNDSFITPNDVLQIFNELNSPVFSASNGQLPVPPPPGPHPFFDVSGDNFVVPNDAIRVINHLNSNPSGEGESDLGAEPELDSGFESANDFVFAQPETRWTNPTDSPFRSGADARGPLEEFIPADMLLDEAEDEAIVGDRGLDQIWSERDNADLYEEITALSHSEQKSDQ